MHNVEPWLFGLCRRRPPAPTLAQAIPMARKAAIGQYCSREATVGEFAHGRSPRTPTTNNSGRRNWPMMNIRYKTGGCSKNSGNGFGRPKHHTCMRFSQPAASTISSTRQASRFIPRSCSGFIPIDRASDTNLAAPKYQQYASSSGRISQTKTSIVLASPGTQHLAACGGPSVHRSVNPAKCPPAAAGARSWAAGQCPCPRACRPESAAGCPRYQ
jgi:hypothetical protein